MVFANLEQNQLAGVELSVLMSKLSSQSTVHTNSPILPVNARRKGLCHLSVKFPGPFSAGNCAEKPIFIGSELEGGAVSTEGEKSVENRT